MFLPFPEFHLGSMSGKVTTPPVASSGFSPVTISLTKAACYLVLNAMITMLLLATLRMGVRHIVHGLRNCRPRLIQGNPGIVMDKTFFQL